jgi:hypothetical protein
MIILSKGVSYLPFSEELLFAKKYLLQTADESAGRSKKK